MKEADDLARRFFGLWAEYLTALATDPHTLEGLRGWLDAAAPPDPLRGAGVPRAAGEPARSPDHAAATAGAPGERDAAVAELARRVDELAARVAALERMGKPAIGSPAAAGTRTSSGTRGRNRVRRS